MVVERHIIALDIVQAAAVQPEAQIHIIVRHCQPFIQAPHLEKTRTAHQQARRSNADQIIHKAVPSIIIGHIIVQQLELMAGSRDGVGDAHMLYQRRPRIQELCANRTDSVLALCGMYTIDEL